MKRILIGLVVVAGGLALLANNALGIMNALVKTSDLQITTAIAFGSADRQKLNVYKPERADGALQPVVVFFYGGSWKRGERDDYLFAAERLTEIGYTVVVPDYRLYPEVRFPSFVEDAAQAVKWTFDNIENYDGDPENIFLMGHSAGAHIAAMLGLDESYLNAVGVDAHRIKGVVGLAGPYAFHPAETANIAPIFAALADENTARPISFVDGREPPFLLLHGGSDTVVYQENSTLLAKTMKAAGGTADVIVYPEVDHIDLVLGLSLSPLRPDQPILADIKSFMDAHLTGSTASR